MLPLCLGPGCRLRSKLKELDPWRRSVTEMPKMAPEIVPPIIARERHVGACAENRHIKILGNGVGTCWGGGVRYDWPGHSGRQTSGKVRAPTWRVQAASRNVKGFGVRAGGSKNRQVRRASRRVTLELFPMASLRSRTVESRGGPECPSSRSSIVELNRKTPRMLPCGQPPLILLISDCEVPTFTVMRRLERKEAMKARTWDEAPSLANDLRQC